MTNCDGVNFDKELEVSYNSDEWFDCSLVFYGEICPFVIVNLGDYFITFNKGGNLIRFVSALSYEGHPYPQSIAKVWTVRNRKDKND